MPGRMTEPLAIHGGRPVVIEPLPGTLQGVLEIGDEEIAAVTAVLRRKTMFRFLNTPDISEASQLEAAYRRMLGVPHALAVGGGGTSALIAALVGLGIGSGDEVIVPGYTYIATAAACLCVGAIPILCEVDQTLTIDASRIAELITPYTRAIIPVHMRGCIADMDGVMNVARRHNLKVLEDCAQANGGTYRGRHVGSIGDAGAFSLQHYKVITAGEGGMVTCHDERVFRRAAMKHDSAMQFWKPDGKWEMFAGENFRMDELRAALGLAQFGKLQSLLAGCRAAKQSLRQKTSHLPHLIQQPSSDADGDCGTAFAFFLSTPEQARSFSEALAAEGVPNQTVYNKQIPDRHIYAAWDYVMEKKTHDHTGWPWTAAHRPIEYRTDMLPQTLDVLSRCIAIGLNQRWDERSTTLVAQAIAKVHHGLSTPAVAPLSATV